MAMFPRARNGWLDPMVAPTVPVLRQRVSTALTSRKGARLALVIALVSFLALLGLFSMVKAPDRSSVEPAGSESGQVAALLSEFPGADWQSVVMVATRTDDTRLDQTELAGLRGLMPALDTFTGSTSTGPRVSDDGAAAVIVTPIEVTSDATATATADTVRDLRALIADHAPDGLRLQVTGGPAFGADVALAFDGADITLLLVTIGIVALLLIGTYRSPILWILPLTVVGLADQLAAKVTGALGSWLGLQFDAGIISVLVFGAGANYSLLLISRYREELLHTEDARAALAAAWRKTVPAVLASNITVVLSLVTLIVAVIPRTRGLSIPAAAGLLIAMAAVLFALPPLLAVCGRKAFWPLVPTPGSTRREGRWWSAIARRVTAKPIASLAGGIAILAVMGAGLLGTSVGLDQLAKFRAPAESAAGLEVMSQHFPPGEAQPMVIVTRSAEATRVTAAAAATVGVVRARPLGTSADGVLTKMMVTGQYAPSTEQSLDLVRELRDTLHAIPGADALVGGQVAEDLDSRAGADRDLLVIAPLVLAVTLLVLLALLRSLIAPILLLAVNLASAAAAIGAGSWLSRALFDQPALDVEVPVLAFLFLVALGVDYTIFLVHRIRTEAADVGTRRAVVRAVAHTGSVITSAGIVLAAVFAALGVLPLVTLGQLGLIVGLGVVVDTVVVRSVVVPALFTLLGTRIWWPGRAPDADRGAVGAGGRREEELTHEPDPVTST
jgi:RND superfamily putative drug exporter